MADRADYMAVPIDCAPLGLEIDRLMCSLVGKHPCCLVRRMLWLEAGNGCKGTCALTGVRLAAMDLHATYFMRVTLMAQLGLRLEFTTTTSAVKLCC
jgi:hypothetical protein